MPKPTAFVAAALLASMAWLASWAAPAQAAPLLAAPAESARAPGVLVAQAEPGAPAAAGHEAAAGAVAGHGTSAGGEVGGHEEAGYDAGQWRNFLYRVMNFVVYAAILYILLRKPVSGFLEGRRQNISRTVEYLETQARNYEEQAKVMRRKLDELAQDRETTLRRYEEDGARERDRIIAEAQKAADLIVERTEAAMAQELKAARRTLTKEASALAMALAGDLLAKEVTGEDRARLAHEFVERVIKLPALN